MRMNFAANFTNREALILAEALRLEEDPIYP